VAAPARNRLLQGVPDRCAHGRSAPGSAAATAFSKPRQRLALLVWRDGPGRGPLSRAEFQAHFASLLEERRADPDFIRSGDPYARYGGRSLHTRSHGEAFIAMFATWMQPSMILMDEPEAALSPQRQLALLVQMAKLGRRPDVQFIIATHSPILLTYPDAALSQRQQRKQITLGADPGDHDLRACCHGAHHSTSRMMRPTSSSRPRSSAGFIALRGRR